MPNLSTGVPVEIRTQINAHGAETPLLLTSNKVTAYRCCGVELVDRPREVSGTRTFVKMRLRLVNLDGSDHLTNLTKSVIKVSDSTSPVYAKFQEHYWITSWDLLNLRNICRVKACVFRGPMA